MAEIQGAATISEADLEDWRSRLTWERGLNKRYEARMTREGACWDDPVLDGLSEDDRMWEVVQMGFRQVGEFLEAIGMIHHYETFISRGLTYGAKLRFLTRFYVDKWMPQITDEREKEVILKASAEVCRDESIRFFKARYGDVDQYLNDCVKGRRLYSEKHGQEWFRNLQDLEAPRESEIKEFDEKWAVLPEDFALFDSHNDWAAAVGCDGFVFLWPVDEESEAPPCVRCRLLHSQVVTDLVVDWTRMVSVTCGGDSKLQICDLGKNKIIGTVKEVSEDQSYISLDADLAVQKAAVGTNFGPIKVCDLATEKVVMALKGHKDWVTTTRADWDANQIVSCSWDSFIHVYDVRSGKLTRKLSGHKQTCEKMDVDFERQMALSSAME
ncbi:unnamed protein product, partial [Polarella glacialis]